MATPREPDGARAEARAVEAAAIRRRWITLGELLAVVAVVISALTLWNSWSERRDTAADKRAEERQVDARAALLVLSASGTGKTLALRPAAAEQQVQSQTVTFPSKLGVPPAQTTGEPRIEAAWFERALVKAREHAGLADASRGDERLPVAIVTRYLVDGAAREDSAIYDVGYTVTGGWLSGHSVTLRGISLVARTRGSQAGRMLDARWARLPASR